ncbi:MAG TPA: branched-chain amino acid ABC transporter permease [Thermoleophilaceae bacterium]|nr:branched-chain amino acid ABC transporter permease [Thermoleophilaceae bacterium]
MSVVAERFNRHPNLFIALGFIALGLMFPFFFDSGAGQMQTAVQALAYVAMALGLNLIVGFAGLLDLGYVAFYALGAYTMGWLGSGFFSEAGGGDGLHILVSGQITALPGVHVNFLLVIVAAVIVTTIAGMLIGLPTLRLRGDYIAIVTLAFGEIVGRIAINGDEITVNGTPLTAGRQGITPVDKIKLPGLDQFQALDLRPWYFVALAIVVVVLIVNFRLRDSRLGRAWVAMREDEVAAASMGVPLVKTKLLAYGTGAAFGGVSGAFLASFLNTVNADQFQFSFSIFILAMIILGGLASIWGTVVGAIALSIINFYLIPEVFKNAPQKIGLNFDLTELSFGIFGFLLVIMMVLRPEGLIPERRRKIELHEGVGPTSGVGKTVVEAKG